MDNILLVTEQRLSGLWARLQNGRGSLLKVRGQLALLPCTAISRNFRVKKLVLLFVAAILIWASWDHFKSQHDVDGRLVGLRLIFDGKGMLASISSAIGLGGNIVEIYHQRMFYDAQQN